MMRTHMARGAGVSALPWSLSHHASALAAALLGSRMALLLAKLLTHLRLLLEAGLLWTVMNHAWGDAHGLAQSVPRTFRLFRWVVQAGWAYKRFRATSALDPSSEEFTTQMEAMHVFWATELAAVCRLNGGVYVKFGQFAVAFGAIPPEYRRILATLEDKARPQPWHEVEKALMAELGLVKGAALVGPPGSRAPFIEFAQEATAAASLAQVHRARLASGQEVAVKLQYPGLRRAVGADLRSMRVLANVAATLFPEYNMVWLYKEMTAKLSVELDFRIEMHNAARMRSLLDGPMRGHSAAYVPLMYEQLCTERLVVMEWIQGAKLTDIAALKKKAISPHAVGMQLVHLFAELTLVHGYVHADPHPGNLMVRPRGKRSFFNWLFRGSKQPFEIVLLDHGSYLSIPPVLREQYCQLWCSFITAEKQIQAELSEAIAGPRAGRALPLLLTHNAARREFKELQKSVGISSIADMTSILNSAPRDLVEVLRINAVIRSSSGILGVTMAERKRVFAWFARRGLPHAWCTAQHVHASTRSLLYRSRLIALLIAYSSWVYCATVLSKAAGALRRVVCGGPDPDD